MFMVVSFPWPVASAYAGIWDHVSASDGSTRQNPHTDVRVQPEIRVKPEVRVQPELVGAGQAN